MKPNVWEEMSEEGNYSTKNYCNYWKRFQFITE